MSEQNHTEVENKRLDEIHRLNVQNDWLLEDFILGFNDSEDAFVSITLCVKGVVVSGNLISGKKYFKELGELFKESFKNRSDSDGFDYVKHYSELADSIYKKRNESESEPLPAPTYIHLNNAKILMGVAQLNAGLWRGRLRDIDGFNFGSVTKN